MKKALLLFVTLVFTGLSLLSPQEKIITVTYPASNEVPSYENISSVTRKLGYSVGDSVDNIGNLYIRAWSTHPTVFTFVGKDGTVSVCASDKSAKTTYVYEYDANLEELKTLRFENKFDQTGAFAKDDEGNYYIFFAKSSPGQNTENMVLDKYNPAGEIINSYKLVAYAKNSFGGIKIPFDAGTCKIEISGSMIAVYLARKMFNGHQASYGFILNKNTFEKIDVGQVTDSGYTITGNNGMPYVSHSFNQFILPIDDGFIFADHGDAYPRGFIFSRFIAGKNTIRINALKFPGDTGVNATYAEMGGLVKIPDGYMFAGAYGKDRNNPRNVFILTFDKNLEKCSAPVYLTSYTKNDGHAGHPKITELDSGRYLLLWEQFSFSTQTANVIESCATGYLSTFALIINAQGKTISGPIEIKGIRLNMNDVLRYNPKNGQVYWTINNDSNSITVYALNPSK